MTHSCGAVIHSEGRPDDDSSVTMCIVLVSVAVCCNVAACCVYMFFGVCIYVCVLHACTLSESINDNVDRASACCSVLQCCSGAGVHTSMCVHVCMCSACVHRIEIYR